MSYAEFPHTNYEVTDFRELIHYYKELVGNYEGTLNKITALTERLDLYERNTTEFVNRTITEQVNSKVQAAVALYHEEYTQALKTLQESFNRLQTSFSLLEQATEKKMDDTVANVQGMLEDYKKQVDYDISVLRNQLLREVDKLSNRIELNASSIIETDTESRRRDDILHRDIETLKAEINMQFDTMKIWTTSSIMASEAITKDYIDRKIDAIHKLLESMEESKVLEELKRVWKYGCDFGGYNCMQWYMDSSITCDDWNKSKISCLDWHVRGREVFHWFEHHYLYMFNPMTGERVDVRKALLDVTNAIRRISGLTAEEYDRLNLTAGSYDSDKVTAYDYDWKGVY